MRSGYARVSTDGQSVGALVGHDLPHPNEHGVYLRTIVGLCRLANGCRVPQWKMPRSGTPTVVYERDRPIQFFRRLFGRGTPGDPNKTSAERYTVRLRDGTSIRYLNGKGFVSNPKEITSWITKKEDAEQVLSRFLQLGGGSVSGITAEIVRESELSSAPNLICSSCKKRYKIGEDSVAISLDYAAGLSKKAFVLQSSSSGSTEDLVDTLDGVAPSALDGARDRARKSWAIIEQSLARGDSRQWRCKACDGVNVYG